MAEALSERHDRIVLDTPRREMECVWTGDVVPTDGPALVLKTQGGIHTTTRAAFCKLSAVPSLQEALMEFEEPEEISNSDAVELGPAGNVRFHSLSSGQRRSCAVCDTYISGSTPTYTFYQQKLKGHTSHTTVRMHAECRDDMLDVLERVWNRAGAVLGDHL